LETFTLVCYSFNKEKNNTGGWNSMHRIIFLQSVEDEITHRRISEIQEHPGLKGCEFSFCYAIELKDADKKLHPINIVTKVLRKGNFIFEPELMVERLKQEITSFKAEMLIVHPGFVFKFFYLDFNASLETIQKEFPDLKIWSNKFDVTFDKRQRIDWNYFELEIEGVYSILADTFWDVRAS